MPDRSDTESGRDRGFIGFRCDPDLKRQEKEQAEDKGVTLSEHLRSKLGKSSTEG